MPAELVGWGGPIPILFICLLFYWRRLTTIQRVVFVVIVYSISILTGILSNEVWDVGNYPSAVIAGVIAPVIYCILFGLISQTRKLKAEIRTRTIGVSKATKSKKAVSQVLAPPDAQETVPVTREASQWNPIIIAAIIQAVASIIVAIITVLGK